MPTYDYACADCGAFDALRRIDERNQAVACPACGRPSPRVLAAPPRLATMDGILRQALTANERSRHEPRRARLAHAAGCGCCAPKAKARSLPGRRPWMISH